ncbi:MAG TPA: protoporphyrinogen oxidase, partial [Candidatus Acidoferrum sp.]|nr:protoporphyrinogen oxidase [Candidatus Acidoferrum sp.]
DGFLLELGPQSFSGTAALRTMCADLGIEDQVVHAPARAPRYVLIDGALKAVPLTPPAMLTSSLLSLKTKWSVARDVFGRSSPPDNDESIASFVRRKFGAELLDRLVGPFVSGIYAGDPEKLSLRSSFPQLHEAEKSAGSVIRGMMRAAKSRKGPRERPALLSFRDGNETLVRGLATKLGSHLQLGAEVLGIAIRNQAGKPGFELSIRQASGDALLVSDHLVLATSADVAGMLLRDVNPAFEPLLAGIEYAPVAVVSLSYRREDIGHSLDGFGFLAPRSSGLRLLGCIWNSSLFPKRAPANHVLLTSFVGGATDPAAATLSAKDLRDLVHRELTPLLQIRASVAFSNVQIYRQALPQYNLGHADRLLALEKLRRSVPGLFFVGNYLQGPAIGSCVDLAIATAQAIAG